MRKVILLLFMSFAFILNSQTLLRVEYFIDTDPGFGNGIELKDINNEKIDFTVPLDLYSPGSHILYIRSFDSQNRWSQTCSYPFLVTPVKQDEVALSKIEYFIDNEPGYDNAIKLKEINEGDFSFVIPCNELSPGAHVAYIRAADTKGDWSSVKSLSFYVRGSQPDIVKIEYYFNNDPGIGNGTEVELDEKSQHIDLSFTADLKDLDEGIHTLNIRGMNEDGLWSTIESAPFELISSSLNQFKWIMQYGINYDLGSDNLNIMFNDNLAADTFYEIYDSKGVLSASGVLPTGNKNYNINAGKIGEGIYILKIRNSDYNSAKRFIVKK